MKAIMTIIGAFTTILVGIAFTYGASLDVPTGDHGLSLPIWILSILGLISMLLALWRWSGKSLPPEAVVDRFMLQEKPESDVNSSNPEANEQSELTDERQADIEVRNDSFETLANRPDDTIEPIPEPTDFDEFVKSYYLRRDPTSALAWLEEAVSYFAHLEQPLQASPTIYFFFRIASIEPTIIVQYEKFIDPISDPDAKRLVSSIAQLATGASPKDVTFPVDERFPVGLDLLERDIVACVDLDYLWMEFFVTGNEKAIERIVQVLGWPDRVRSMLEEWLETDGSWPKRLAKTWKAAHLRRLTGIEIDIRAKQILTIDDLDCVCALNSHSETRTAKEFSKIRSVLPFDLSREDIDHLLVKMAAKWSVVSLYDAPEVQNVCDQLAESLPEKALGAGPPVSREYTGRIASRMAYGRPPLFETVTVRAYALEAVIIALGALFFFDSGLLFLEWLDERTLDAPFVLGGIAALCLAVAIGVGVVRQLFGHLMSRCGALPVIDAHGRAKLAYVGDVPPRVWQYSPWYRAGTWVIVAVTSVLAVLIGSSIGQIWFGYEAVLPTILALLVFRWLISSIPKRFVSSTEIPTETNIDNG